MKTIAQMINDVIRREGGYVDHPADKGGPTKYGITLAAFSDWRGSEANIGDLQEIDKATARAIYREDYYLIPKIDQLPPSIQPFVFDAAVNHGPAQAIKFVQQVCVAAGHDPGPIDGIIGPRTIWAATSYVNVFLRDLIDRRQAFYRDLVRRNPSQKVFMAGWLARLDEFRA